MSGKRLYTLFTPHPWSAYLTPRRRHWWREDEETWWKLTVRAYSIEQAYFLAGNRIRAEGDGVGIVEFRPPTRDPTEIV